MVLKKYGKTKKQTGLFEIMKDFEIQFQFYRQEMKKKEVTRIQKIKIPKISSFTPLLLRRISPRIYNPK